MRLSSEDGLSSVWTASSSVPQRAKQARKSPRDGSKIVQPALGAALPAGETRETIRLSKKLPLDLALFPIAAPHPGSPFFFEVVENGWFRPGTQWEQVDMDRSTVLDYPQLRAEELEHWAQRAFREWALKPGPMLT